MEHTNTSATETQKEMLGRKFVLLINKMEGYYGTLDELKGTIAKHVESGGEAMECSIGEFKQLNNVVIETKRDVHIPYDEVNREYEEFGDEYEVHLHGHRTESFSEIYYATEYMEKLLEEQPHLELEDDIQLVRKATFGCDYTAMAETKVAITIPPQVIDPPSQIEGIAWESKSNAYLMQEAQKIQDILTKRNLYTPDPHIDLL